jgi:hypothetical protein
LYFRIVFLSSPSGDMLKTKAVIFFIDFLLRLIWDQLSFALSLFLIKIVISGLYLKSSFGMHKYPS